MDSPQLFDKRADLWRSAFEQARPLEKFLEGGVQNHVERWRGYSGRLTLSDAHTATLASFKREMNVVVLAGMWCGDCARQCPMIAMIGQTASSMRVRFIDNNEIPELRDELRIHGASRVPVAVTLSEDFFEVGRSGDRTLSAYRRKAATELGDACDAGIVPPGAAELAVELGEWVEHFERHQLLLRLSPFLRRRHND
jgi:thiol-disulfide isomerase/thioredoxin